MRLIAVLDEPQTAALTLNTASQLAERLGGAELCVFHPIPDTNPDFQSPDEGLPDPAQQAHFTHMLATRAKAVFQIFETWHTAMPSRAYAHWLEQTGDIRTLLRHVGATADFVVLDPTTPTSAQTTRQIFATALYDMQATVLMAPHTTQASFAQHPVVAWQDTPNLLSAVHSALPLLKTAQHVTVLVGESHPNATPEPALLAQLRACGVGVTLERFALTGHSALGGQIRARAAQAGADLLVMGAYGRPHFVEWLFGGPTVDLLAHAPWPILTHH
ncbi:MAG: universal stress protein [Acetobacter sp.]